MHSFLKTRKRTFLQLFFALFAVFAIAKKAGLSDTWTFNGTQAPVLKQCELVAARKKVWEAGVQLDRSPGRVVVLCRELWNTNPKQHI